MNDIWRSQRQMVQEEPTRVYTCPRCDFVSTIKREWDTHIEEEYADE